MNWLGKFILALVACLTAFLAIFSGSCAEMIKYAEKVTPSADAQIQQFPRLTPAVTQAPYEDGPLQVDRPRQASGPIRFSIIDQLGTGQTSETVSITLGGKPFGTINVDSLHTIGEIPGTAASSGASEYDVVANLNFSFGTLHCTGQGSVYLANGVKYYLTVDYNSAPCALGLQPGA